MRIALASAFLFLAACDSDVESCEQNDTGSTIETIPLCYVEYGVCFVTASEEGIPVYHHDVSDVEDIHTENLEYTLWMETNKYYFFSTTGFYCFMEYDVSDVYMNAPTMVKWHHPGNGRPMLCITAEE